MVILICVYIMLYIIGWAVAYSALSNLKVLCTHRPMDQGDRGFASFLACFSWLMVGIIIVVLSLFVLLKVVKPLLMMLEPKVEIEEE